MPTNTTQRAREELGRCLRSWRDRATPATRIRGTQGARRARRAPGLRREEVAVAAGISTTWYTWLEQGRPLGVSAQTLHGIARALQLESAEYGHLSALADAASGDRSTDTRRTMRASPALHVLLDALQPNAAYAINALWDVLAANRAAVTMLGDFAARRGTTDNVLRRLFLDAEWRERLVAWPALADWAVAHFRAATARYVGQPDWEQFVESLAVESPEFASRWARYEIRGVESAIVEVRRGDGASARYHAEALAVDAAAGDVRVALYIPLGDASRTESP